jgi:hypothetical protein
LPSLGGGGGGREGSSRSPKRVAAPRRRELRNSLWPGVSHLLKLGSALAKVVWQAGAEAGDGVSERVEDVKDELEVAVRGLWIASSK